MKLILVVLLVSLAFQLFAGENVLESVITEVTVYYDQALVTREAEVVLEKGKHELIFDKIPSDYQENSIQVKGFGNAIIKDVKKIRDYVTEEQHEGRKTLYKAIRSLEEEIKVLQDQESLAKNEQQIVQAIMDKLTNQENKEEKIELNPDKWIQIVDFYRNRNISLNEELRNLNKQIVVKESEKGKLNKQIRELGNTGEKEINRIKILVEAEKSGKVKLKLSYIVFNATWYPLYDIRVSSDTKVMNLTYKANVSQRTSEDWKNVKLNISTAQPHAGAEHPELRPWRINLYEENRKKVRLAKSFTKQSVGMEQMYSGGSMKNEIGYSIDGMSVSEPEEDMTILTSAITENITSSVFEIPGSNTILSDNQEHQVTITIKDFPAYFRYSTVPKLSQFAYLKAKVTNDSEYPLLAGEANIFLDDNFVTTSTFDFAAPTDEFWTFLGVDESIKIEHKLIRKFKEKLGVFSKKEKQFYEYEISLKNNKKTEEEIVVWDQIPISQNEEIKVQLVKPEYIKDTETLKMNEDKFLEWFYKLEPGKEQKISLIFSIEYPKNKYLEGLK